MMKQRRELGLRRFWSAVRSSNSSSSSQCEQGPQDEGSPTVDAKPGPHCSLPLLQVWPSSDSPRGEADGQSFVFPDDIASARLDAHQGNDSGIESNQPSPQPPPPPPPSCCVAAPSSPSPSRRPSFHLHPDDARSLLRAAPPPPTPRRLRDDGPASSDSESSSSLDSVAAAAAKPSSGSSTTDGRRRSSARSYSIFDALDLEYALLRAAARGSVGPCSLLGESTHKLTFTQSLAFPALARGTRTTRRKPSEGDRSRRPPGDPPGGGAPSIGVNAFAKCVTAMVLVLISVLVFAVVYRFART